MEFSSGVIFRRDYSIQNLTRNWREEGNIGINYDVHDRVTGLMNGEATKTIITTGSFRSRPFLDHISSKIKLKQLS